MSTFWRDQRRRVTARYRGGSLDSLVRRDRTSPFGQDRQRMGERLLNMRSSPQRALGQVRAIKALLKTGRLPVGRRAQALRYSRPLARGALIAADQGANEATMAWLRAVAPALATVIEQEWVPIAERAVNYFPVDTGLARDSMTFSLLRTGDDLRLMISNPVRYMHYIRWGQRSGPGRAARAREATQRAQSLGITIGRSPWWDLVRRPVTDAARAMVDRLGTELEREASKPGGR